MVAGIAAHLLGSHVADRAEEAAGLRRRRRQRLGVLVGGGIAPRHARRHQLDQAEVEDLHQSVAREEDVLRLEVAVDDAALVRRGEAAGELPGVVDGLARRQRAVLAKARAQRLALEELRDDVALIALAAEVVDGQDVRMIEHPRGARLLLETPQGVGIVREAARQHLHRDVAAEARVVRAIDLAHPPGPDCIDDAIGTEHRSGGKHAGEV